MRLANIRTLYDRFKGPTGGYCENPLQIREQAILPCGLFRALRALSHPFWQAKRCLALLGYNPLQPAYGERVSG